MGRLPRRADTRLVEEAAQNRDLALLTELVAVQQAVVAYAVDVQETKS